jgi:hypothetical protein
MSTLGDAAEVVKDGANETAEKVKNNSWVERFARFGYLVRGVLYAVVGLLSVSLALGLGGGTTDKQGAIAAIGHQPFGKALLVVTAVGLAGYSLWGFIRAFLDPLGRGTDPKGLAERAGYVVSGLVYGSLIFPTVRLIVGAGAGDENGSAEKYTSAWLLAQPYGQWLLGIAGVIGMVGGLGQLYQAYSAGFKDDFKRGEMSADEMRSAERVGRVGHAARGVVFTLIGFFIVRAAWTANPNEVRGLDGTLQVLLAQPYGPWLLGIVALGLVAFGIYSIFCAKWMQVSPSDG